MLHYLFIFAYVYTRVHTQKPEVNVMCFPLLLFGLCSETGKALPLNFELIQWLDWLVSQLGRSVSVFLPSAGIMEMLCHTQLFTATGDPNSSPQPLYPLSYRQLPPPHPQPL